ncbi:MAG: hypothetical protein LBQ77_03065 [Treponema sp.]|jgi:hypothetical protein|nr:hypothetical protein [Treponema sp.]
MNFLTAMLGVSLVLGMTVIGCDNSGGGDGVLSTVAARAFLSTQVPQPEENPPLLFAFMDPDTKYAVGVFKTGSIPSQLIAHDAVYYHDGINGSAATFGLTNTNETEISNTIINSVETSVSVGATLKVSAGAEVGFDVGKLTAKVKNEVELGTSIESGIKKLEGYQTTTSVKTSRSFTQSYTYDFDARPEGYYIFGAFSFVDHYVAVSVDPATKTVVGIDEYHGIGSTPVIALEYSATNPTARSGLVISNDKKLNVDFTADPTKIIEEAAKNGTKPVENPVVEPVTYYTETRTNDLDDVGSRDETIYPNFSVNALKSFGYNKVRIDVSYRFKAESIWGGDLRLRIATPGKNSQLGLKNASRGTSWGDGSYSITVPIDSLENAACTFMLLWSNMGAAEYCVGKRTITITAIKELL